MTTVPATWSAATITQACTLFEGVNCTNDGHVEMMCVDNTFARKLLTDETPFTSNIVGQDRFGGSVPCEFFDFPDLKYFIVVKQPRLVGRVDHCDNICAPLAGQLRIFNMAENKLEGTQTAYHCE